MKILLLEDENQIAENIKEYLKLKEDYDVDIAETIKQAKEKIENNYYDVLLFDVIITDGESYNLANEIKKNIMICLSFFWLQNEDFKIN